MKICDFCGRETDDYKLIPELDNQVMCQDCLESEVDAWRKIESDGFLDETAYDYGYDGEGW